MNSQLITGFKGPWESKIVWLVKLLSQDIGAGKITLPLDVTALQGGRVVLLMKLDANADMIAVILATFATVTFPLSATIAGANSSLPITIP